MSDPPFTPPPSEMPDAEDSSQEFPAESIPFANDPLPSQPPAPQAVPSETEADPSESGNATSADSLDTELRAVRQQFAVLYNEPDLLKREYLLAQLAEQSRIDPERFYALFNAYCQIQAGEPEALTSTNLDKLKLYFGEIRATRNYRDRNYKLIQAAKNWDIPLEQCRALFNAYCREQQNLPQHERVSLWWKGVVNNVVRFAAAIALLSQFTIVVGIVFYLLEAGDRKEASYLNAWKTIKDAKGETASFGRINALEDLTKGCKGYQQKSFWHTTPIVRDFFASCIDLRGLDVSNAYLATVDLRWARLQDANFTSARLWSAQFQAAELQRAQFQQARLGGAQLQGANLTGAALSQADLPQANFNRAILKGAKLEEAVLRSASLERANLEGANLRNADLSNTANAFNYNQEADLTSVLMQLFSGDSIIAAIAQPIPDTPTNLQTATLVDANLSNANLSNANLQGADLKAANLTGADLSGADLRRAKHLDQANLTDIITDDTTQFPPDFTFP